MTIATLNIYVFILCYCFPWIIISQDLPTISIFSTMHSIQATNKAAIQSWLRLPQVTKIVLICNIDNNMRKEMNAIKVESGSSIDIELEDRMDTNFLGRPLLNAVLYRTLAADTNIAIYINSDVHMYPDVIKAINKVRETHSNFVAMAGRWDVEDPHGKLSTAQSSDGMQALRDWITNSGSRQVDGIVNMWAYNVDTPLLKILVPTFAVNRGKYDKWLTHELQVSSDRTCVDITDVVTLVSAVNNFHLHDPKPIRRMQQQDESDIDNSRKSKKSKRSRRYRSKMKLRLPSQKDPYAVNNYWTTINEPNSFETFINGHIAYSHGSFTSSLGSVHQISNHMTYCNGELCIVQRKVLSECVCENKNNDNKMDCGVMCPSSTHESIENYNLNDTLHDDYDGSIGIPFTLPSLVKTLAIDNTIILTAATHAYKEVIMSWVCNLKKLKITNYVVGALDPEMYKYLYIHGVPVYFEDILKTMRSKKERVHANSVQSAGCDGYHSGCFKLLTKLKSRTMYRILQLGYNVIWSDSDIVWFKNPVPYLVDLKKRYEETSEGLLIIQSNEPNNTLPLNGIRRINSGFYLATPTNKSLERLDAVIMRASKSKMSEQPNFYDELCGTNGEFRAGDNECFDRGMRVVYLDTKMFPNGGCPGLPPHHEGIGGIWNSTDHTRDFPELYILHNNWIIGLSSKLERQESRGLFFYDTKNQICRWDWTKKIPYI